MDDRNNVSRLIIDSVGVGSALPQLSSQRAGDRPTLLAAMPMTNTRGWRHQAHEPSSVRSATKSRGGRHGSRGVRRGSLAGAHWLWSTTRRSIRWMLTSAISLAGIRVDDHPDVDPSFLLAAL